MTTSPPPSHSLKLRGEAERLGASLPPLLIEARHLASSVAFGAHGRRRAGIGDDFWQYRPFQTGDSPRMIDWRRSGRSDQEYIREREWQVARAAALWVDPGASMSFASQGRFPEKGARAQVLALALALLMMRAGERVGLASGSVLPGCGEAQALRLAQGMMQVPASGAGEYATPDVGGLNTGVGCAVFFSDFLAPPEQFTGAVSAALERASRHNVRAVLVQITDPAEESFPYRGRVMFESMGQGLRFEARKAGSLAQTYRRTLAERRGALQTLAGRLGWQVVCHRTDESASAALLRLWQMVGMAS